MRGDLEWGTVPRLVRSAAERFPNLEAVVDGDVRLTFAQLGDLAEQATRAFIGSGPLLRGGHFEMQGIAVRR